MTIALPLIVDPDAWRAGIRVVMADRHSRSDTLDCITDPRLRRLADYWLSRRAGRPLPARADIDPLDLSWALPYLYLVDCVTDAGPGADGGPWRYRYRLAGEQIEQVFRGRVGRSSVRHAWLDEMVSADALPLVMQRWRPLPESGQILFMQGMIYRVADHFVRGRRLLLPLAETAGGPITGLIGMTLCDWQERPVPTDEAEIAITHIPAAALA
jgi:hypothetical protein